MQHHQQRARQHPPRQHGVQGILADQATHQLTPSREKIIQTCMNFQSFYVPYCKTKFCEVD